MSFNKQPESKKQERCTKARAQMMNETEKEKYAVAARSSSSNFNGSMESGNP